MTENLQMKPLIHENLSRAEYLVFMFHILYHRNIKAETLYDTFFFHAPNPITQILTQCISLVHWLINRFYNSMVSLYLLIILLNMSHKKGLLGNKLNLKFLAILRFMITCYIAQYTRLARILLLCIF